MTQKQLLAKVAAQNERIELRLKLIAEKVIDLELAITYYREDNKELAERVNRLFAAANKEY